MSVGNVVFSATTERGNVMKLIRINRAMRKEFHRQFYLVLFDKDEYVKKYKGFSLKKSAMRLLDEWKVLY
jgi:uncharacterized protein (DUF1697 family)